MLGGELRRRGKNRADEGAGEAKFGSDIAAATRGLFAEPGRQGSTRVPPREGFLQETASGFPPRCRQRQTLHCLWSETLLHRLWSETLTTALSLVRA